MCDKNEFCYDEILFCVHKIGFDYKKIKSQSAPRNREVMDDLELENIKLEKEKHVQEIKKLTLEQKKLESEDRKLQTEIKLIEIKKSYLICKLNAEFPECLLDPFCI